MKFSYSLLKKIVPDIQSKDDLIKKLTMGLFEVEEAVGDTLDVKVMPNRYSDAASHWGLSREIAALHGIEFKEPKIKLVETKIQKRVPVTVEIPKLCPRMTVRYFEGITIKPSPKWMQDVLKSCGMRPINNLVDITNYVTLETGQPLHAFDFDKFADSRRSNADSRRLLVRQAFNGERLELLDGAKLKLDSSMLVLSDGKDPLDVAGIKGGKKAEITSKTKNILLTAGNFDGVSIYKTSKKLNLVTNASVRFSHNISPELVSIGIARAGELIAELCQARAGVLVDVYPKKQPKQIIKFDIDRLNRILGTNIKKEEAQTFLKLLGFKVKGDLVEVPQLRTDITIFEDLVEEIARLYGYNRIPSAPPHVALHPSGMEDQIVFKDRIRKFLVGLGFDEVYNTSFVDMGMIEVENPIAQDKNALRSSLFPLLLKNIDDNFRFFDSVRIFEIGKVFSGAPRETTVLGVAYGTKTGETFYELKGVIESLVTSFGLTDFVFEERRGKRDVLPYDTEIMVDGKEVGYIGHARRGVNIAELNLDALLPLIEEDIEFKPLPKYPAVERDISVLVDAGVRIGDVIQEIQLLNVHLIQDVDLVDEYVDKKWQGKQSLTFRIVFQAEDHTLKSEEVDKEMKKITEILQEKFNASIR